MSHLGIAIVALAIAVGIAGVVVPVLPGALLVWAAITAWALAVGSPTAFATLGAATVLIGGSQLMKLLVPGRRLVNAGVPRRRLLGLPVRTRPAPRLRPATPRPGLRSRSAS
jgi:hypothetical protein